MNQKLGEVCIQTITVQGGMTSIDIFDLFAEQTSKSVEFLWIRQPVYGGRYWTSNETFHYTQEQLKEILLTYFGEPKID